MGVGFDADDEDDDDASPDAGASHGALVSWRTLGPILASAGSALVVVLAFLLPGVQDQWDRWQGRRVINAYAEVGEHLMREGRYRESEEAFARAFELSENRRLDLERGRLEAHVHRLLLEPTWGAPNPVDIKESDFRSLLVLQSRDGDQRGHARTQALLADFLGSEGRYGEAAAAARAATVSDSTFARGWVSLGNALGEAHDTLGAVSAYRRALRLDRQSAAAAYDLAVLLHARGDTVEAHRLLLRAAELAPDDTLVLAELVQQLQHQGDSAGLRHARQHLASLRAQADRREAPRDTSVP